MQNFSVSKSNFINSNNFTTYYVDVAMEIITGGNITHQRRDTKQGLRSSEAGTSSIIGELRRTIVGLSQWCDVKYRKLECE
jgi:hypothetical protein